MTGARLRVGKAGATGSTLVTLYGGPTKKGVFSGVLVQGSFTAKSLGDTLKGGQVK